MVAICNTVRWDAWKMVNYFSMNGVPWAQDQKDAGALFALNEDHAIFGIFCFFNYHENGTVDFNETRYGFVLFVVWKLILIFFN